MSVNERFVEQPYQDRIHKALGHAVNEDTTTTKEIDSGSVVVTKWVCIVEVMDDKGEKWLTGFRGPTSNSIPVWDAKGLLLYSANDMSFMRDGEDEDDE